MSTLQVDQRPRSVLLQLDVGMKQACQTDECILEGVGQSSIFFQITPAVNLTHKIDESVSISRNEIFGATWIFQKVQVQIRTELGDSQPAVTQSLVPVFKHPTGPTISLPYESSVGSMMQASAHKIEFPVTKVGEQSGK